MTRWFDQRETKYEYHDVNQDAEARLRAEQLGASALPVVILPDGTWFSGFRPHVAAQHVTVQA